SSPSSTNVSNSSENGSGPSFSSGPGSPARRTHHPALRSVPNSFRRTEGRSRNEKRTTAPRGFVVFGGSSRSTRPPCDRCASTRSPGNSKTRYFPRRVTRSSTSPVKVSGGGSKVFSAENCSGLASPNSAPASAASSRSASACTSGSSGIVLLLYGHAERAGARAHLSRLLRRRGGGAPHPPAHRPARPRDAPDGGRLQGLLRRPAPALRAVVPGRRPGGGVPPGRAPR